MSIENTIVRRNVQGFERQPTVTVDRVIVQVGDDSNYYSPSGLTQAQWDAMTGKVMTVSIPFGTQAIADSLRTTLSAKPFQPYKATMGELDPAAELGDWVTVDGLYSVIAKRTFNLDSFGSSDFSAETENVITDKYPYLTQAQAQEQQKLAEITTRLTVAEGEIDLRVEKSGVIASINASTEGITINANKVNITGYVTFTDLSTSGRTSINGANLISGTVTADTVKSSWVYAGEISANQVTAGTFNLGSGYGYIGRGSGSGGSSSTTGVIMSSYGSGSSGLGDSDYYFIATDSGTRMTGSGSHVVCISNEVTLRGSASGCKLHLYYNALVPDSDNTIALGYSSTAYKASYSYDWIEVSDREKKENINYDVSEYRALFDKLKPCSFNYISTDETKLTKTGLIAQDIETAMEEISMPMAKFNGLRFDYDEETHTKSNYSLCYNDFISMLVDQVQMLKARVVQLEANIN